MNIFDFVTGFGSLSFARTTQPKHIIVLLKPPMFEIEPLFFYYIDCPELGDLIVYKVLL
jgi:hypothetical protein